MNFVDTLTFEKHERKWAGDPIAYGNENMFIGWDYKPLKKLKADEYRDEIEERLKLFGLPQKIIDETKEGAFYLNDCGTLSRVTGKEKVFLEKIEKDYEVKVYYVYRDKHYPKMESGYRIFFINNDKENWPKDKVDIKIQDPLCFKYREVNGSRLLYAENIGYYTSKVGLYDIGREN